MKLTLRFPKVKLSRHAIRALRVIKDRRATLLRLRCVLNPPYPPITDTENTLQETLAALDADAFLIDELLLMTPAEPPADADEHKDVQAPLADGFLVRRSQYPRWSV